MSLLSSCHKKSKTNLGKIIYSQEYFGLISFYSPRENNKCSKYYFFGFLLLDLFDGEIILKRSESDEKRDILKYKKYLGV